METNNAAEPTYAERQAVIIRDIHEKLEKLVPGRFRVLQTHGDYGQLYLRSQDSGVSVTTTAKRGYRYPRGPAQLEALHVHNGFLRSERGARYPVRSDGGVNTAKATELAAKLDTLYKEREAARAANIERQATTVQALHDALSAVPGIEVNSDGGSDLRVTLRSASNGIAHTFRITARGGGGGFFDLHVEANTAQELIAKVMEAVKLTEHKP